jgi:hypothetical protein
MVSDHAMRSTAGLPSIEDACHFEGFTANDAT